jgi:serine acetyltransferase
MRENLFRAFRNRVFQHLARILPGARTLRVHLHRARGVRIGNGVWIGYDVILETSRPHLIAIGDRASLSMRVTVVGHFKETQRVIIEDDVFVGPGAIILPNVVIGRGAVVTAGSVVTKSVPPMTVVQGNPATPIARCGLPLGCSASLRQFSRQLKPVYQRTAEIDLTEVEVCPSTRSAVRDSEFLGVQASTSTTSRVDTTSLQGDSCKTLSAGK